ncbi:MAG: hypothetical protein ACUVQD_00725 [Thermaceae bacterium]
MPWVKLHAFLGLLLFVGGFVLSFWALFYFFRDPPRLFFRVLRGMAYAAILQIFLGFFLFFGGLRPQDPLHLLYGTLLATIWHFLGGLGRGAWLYQSLKSPPAQVGPWVAGGMLFALGLLFRVYGTGG